jgi:hypothetical protein
MDWAKMILAGKRDAKGWLEKIVWDYSRPRSIVGGTTIDAPGSKQHWSTIWLREFVASEYQAM